MKKVIYGTILLFVVILIVVIVVATGRDVVQVEYKDGEVVEMTK